MPAGGRTETTPKIRASDERGSPFPMPSMGGLAHRNTPAATRFALLLCLGLLAFGPVNAALAPDTDIDVQASKDGDIVVVDVDLSVRATQHEVWAVLTDYDHMADFVANLEASSIVTRTGNTLDVMQKGTAHWGVLSFPFQSIRRVVLTPQREIQSRVMSGEMTGSEIVTRITPDGATTHVSVRSRYVPTIWIPPVVGTSAIASETRKQWFTLREEILRRRMEAERSAAR
jgi:Polyketide cyclase / dehydrase and lipid transport